MSAVESDIAHGPTCAMIYCDMTIMNKMSRVTDMAIDIKDVFKLLCCFSHPISNQVLLSVVLHDPCNVMSVESDIVYRPHVQCPLHCPVSSLSRPRKDGI